MTDSGSYSSLMALVDSHLSKTSIQASGSDGGLPRFQLPSLTGGPNETLSESRLFLNSGQRLPLPTLSLSDSPIQEVLAKQVSNMLKAKEQKKQYEEEQSQLATQEEKMAEEMRSLKMQDDQQDDCVIDLVKAIEESMYFENPASLQLKEETLNSSSSSGSLLKPNSTKNVKTSEPFLYCKTDMTSILKRKVRQGSCSSFGKVLTSRLKPVAAPYFREKGPTKVVRFDFTTKSPCDIIKESLKQPRPYNRQFDLFSIFPDLEA